MKYYLGETFDKEKNKEYKTLEGGLKAAERERLKLFDENGADVTLHGKLSAPEDAEATEGAGSEEGSQAGNSAPEGENGQEGGKAETTEASEDGGAVAGEGTAPQLPEGVTLVDEDEVPEGAMTPNEDGTYNVYDAEGNVTGTISAAEYHAAGDFTEGAGSEEGSQEGNSAPEGENGQEGGKAETTEASEDGVTEVHGKIRRIFNGTVRIRRSPSWAASAEAGVSKFTEKNVKALHIVDGRPMYATTDGFYISGAADIVEFIEE